MLEPAGRGPIQWSAMRFVKERGSLGRIGPAAAIATLACLAAFAAAEDGTPREPSLARIRTLLERDDPETALREVRRALHFDSDNVRALDLASRAAEAQSRRDLAFWYARQALDAALRVAPERAWALERRLLRLEPDGIDVLEPLDRYLDEVFSLAEYARRSRLYANAIDLYRRLASTRLGARAERRIERIYRDADAVAALLAVDLDLPVPAPDRGTLASLRQPSEPPPFGEAIVLESEHYRVRSNAGTGKARAVLDALERMNRFYREFFAAVGLSGATRPCEIRLYRTRGEFERHEKIRDVSVQAFFDPVDDVLATFDPTSVGLPFARLWSTLFHEASHQFTHRISYTTTLPGWLHEGTSAYFEGARLRPGGVVEPNGIPEERLEALVSILRRGRPSLRDVIGSRRTGFVPREHYAVGWGIVYFAHNYLDENAERPYLAAYRELFGSYRRPGGLAPLARFERLFVRAGGQSSLGDFEPRFEAWIEEFVRLRTGPAQPAARRLVERARHAKERGAHAAAVASYRRAIERVPDHAEAHFELASLLERTGSVDGAILSYRRARAILLARRPDRTASIGGATAVEVADRCAEGIVDLQPKAGARLTRDTTELLAWIEDSVRVAAARGRPRFALTVLGDAIAATGGHPRLRLAREDIAGAAGVDIRRWRRLLPGRRLEPWDAPPGMLETVDGDRLAARARGLSLALHDEAPRVPYRYEAVVEFAAGRRPAVAGIVFASSLESSARFLFVDAAGSVRTGDPALGRAGVRPLARTGEGRSRRVQLAVDIGERGRIGYFLDGELVGTEEVEPETMAGRVGLVVGAGAAHFAALRILQ